MCIESFISEQFAQDRIVFSEARIGTLFHAFHVGLGLIAHGGADGGIDRHRQVRSVSHTVCDATQMLTLL